MDTLQVCASSIDGFKFENCSASVFSNPKLIGGGYRPSVLDESAFGTWGNDPDASTSSSVESPPSADADHQDNATVLKYINEMLMTEDLEGQTCMLQDCLALQAAEKCFYEVLNNESPTSNQSPPSFGGIHDNPGVDFMGRIGTEGDDSNLIDANLDLTTSFINSPEISNLALFSHESGARKTHSREEGVDDSHDERSNKQPALSLPDMEKLEILDEVLLCREENDESEPPDQMVGRPKGRRRSKRYENKAGAVDFWSLLTQCAQAVASFDPRTAPKLLQQIREHASQSGDGTQRLAFYLARGLEARLVGTQTPTYSPMLSTRTSLTRILEAYKVYVTACPFKRMSQFFANRMIRKLTARSTKIHIIDFGILYGFQWPCLIQYLSMRPGGPPTLRITGIELPQPGFRPTERVEETGRRLKRYCERFGVPFAYHFIAKKWETIKLEDLKVDKDETTIVNCLYRLRHIPDETVCVNSPRDAVLKLIRQINPDLFVHGVVNGMFNTPFFVTRFREALFHFSAQFDMLDATISRENEQRMLIEREVVARDAINVIACEGTERVERPETYKQWKVRNTRAGFRQVSLDQEVLRKVRHIVRSSYHKDFVIDVDGDWMLQGWKGRVLYALSCWKPLK